jgi:hypothetical protein
LIQVFNDVLRTFESDAEPDRFDAYASPTLFVGNHLPVGRRGGMTAKRAGDADIDQLFDQLEGVIEERRSMVRAAEFVGDVLIDGRGKRFGRRIKSKSS